MDIGMRLLEGLLHIHQIGRNYSAWVAHPGWRVAGECDLGTSAWLRNHEVNHEISSRRAEELPRSQSGRRYRTGDWSLQHRIRRTGEATSLIGFFVESECMHFSDP